MTVPVYSTIPPYPVSGRVFAEPELLNDAIAQARLFDPFNAAAADLLGDTVWKDLTLAAGWTTPTATDAPAQYRIRDGVIFMRGSVAGTALPAGTLIGTIPRAGTGIRYAPATAKVFCCLAGGGLNGMARIDITDVPASSRTEIVLTDYINGGSSSRVSLDNIVYPQEQW